MFSAGIWHPGGLVSDKTWKIKSDTYNVILRHYHTCLVTYFVSGLSIVSRSVFRTKSNI